MQSDRKTQEGPRVRIGGGGPPGKEQGRASRPGPAASASSRSSSGIVAGTTRYTVTVRRDRVYLVDQAPDSDPDLTPGGAIDLAEALLQAAAHAAKFRTPREPLCMCTGARWTVD